MNTVYILGAGASRDLNFRITNLDAGYRTVQPKDFSVEGPLSRGYFYYFNQISTAIKSSISICPGVNIGKVLVDYIAKKYRIEEVDLLNNKEVSHKINIEDLYLKIESEVNAIYNQNSQDLSLLQNQKNMEIFLALSELRRYLFDTLSFIGYYCISKNHSIFADYVIEKGGNIITFNWDTLLDEAMFNTQRWNYETGYGTEFEKVVYKTAPENSRSFESQNLILKPHGSINWYADIHKKPLYLILPVDISYRSGTYGQLGYREKVNGDSVCAHIIPPGKKRKQLLSIWQIIKNILQEADKIISIGFSFNGNDSHVKEEFKDIRFKHDISVDIVDPNGDCLIGVYKEVFKTKNVITKFRSFADFCITLN